MTTTNPRDFRVINHNEAQKKATSLKPKTLAEKQKRQTRLSIDARLERRQLKQELALTDEEWDNL